MSGTDDEYEFEAYTYNQSPYGKTIFEGEPNDRYCLIGYNDVSRQEHDRYIPYKCSNVKIHSITLQTTQQCNFEIPCDK